MANLPTPKVKTTTIKSQYVYHFEIDSDNYKIKVRAYDRDENGEMVQGTARTSDWINMLNESGEPNLPQSEWAGFAQALPLVTVLAVAFGKVGGVIDQDAVV